MQCAHHWRQGMLGLVFVGSMLTALASLGCSGTGGAFEFFGTPFRQFNPTGTGTTVPGTSGRQTGTSLVGGNRTFTDPCTESQRRKFVTISMRNQSPDYVHYFMVLIAYVNSETYPQGGVCPDDISLYTQFGYSLVPEGVNTEFGHFCIVGPALLYFHERGQFRSTGGTGATSLASAIAPASGATPTYDNTFGSAGMMVPVPDRILFHNPGTTAEGALLKVSDSADNPCDNVLVTNADDDCRQDAWYYVDDSDRRVGSAQAGIPGAGVRTPSEIQGTGCQCGALVLQGDTPAYQVLAPSSAGAADAECNEFFRGGRINYVFVRDDVEPPYPQLLWQVTDSNGVQAHGFDSRANVR